MIFIINKNYTHKIAYMPMKNYTIVQVLLSMLLSWVGIEVQAQDFKLYFANNITDVTDFTKIEDESSPLLWREVKDKDISGNLAEVMEVRRMFASQDLKFRAQQQQFWTMRDHCLLCFRINDGQGKTGSYTVEVRDSAGKSPQTLSVSRYFYVNAPRQGEDVKIKVYKTDNEADSASETAPAEGLELVELADGLAVTGDSRTTYKHRRDIKAHGCTWNKTAQQWEAHSAEDCETLRRWFALREQTTATTQDEPTTDTSEPEAEPTQAGPRKLQNVEVLTNDFGTVRVGDRVTDGRHVGKFLCYACKDANDPGVLVIIDDDLQVHEANPLKVRRADGTPTESHQDSETGNTATDTNDEPQQPQSEPQSDDTTAHGPRIHFDPEDVPDFEEAA